MNSDKQKNVISLWHFCLPCNHDIINIWKHTKITVYGLSFSFFPFFSWFITPIFLKILYLKSFLVVFNVHITIVFKPVLNSIDYIMLLAFLFSTAVYSTNFYKDVFFQLMLFGYLFHFLFWVSKTYISLQIPTPLDATVVFVSDS